MPQEPEHELESQPGPSTHAKKPQSENREVNEVEEVIAKPRSRSRKKAQETQVETNPSAGHTKADSDIEEIKKPPSRRGRKRLAEDTEDEMPKKSRKTRRHEPDDDQSVTVHMYEEVAPSAKPKRPRSTANIRAPSVQSTVVEDSIDDVAEQEQKKRKRKINIFAEPSSLGFMSQVCLLVTFRTHC